jgi:hypothetical protein
MVAIEATGGFAFAQALGKRAKTDLIDAAVMAPLCRGVSSAAARHPAHAMEFTLGAASAATFAAARATRVPTSVVTVRAYPLTQSRQ